MLANAVHLAADQSLTDEAIISHVLRGKTEEYEILVRRYNNLLYKTARGILSAENDIEDVMQEAYIRDMRSWVNSGKRQNSPHG
jgi:RNA polymerase sigma-70 factor (ECF subfamily)